MQRVLSMAGNTYNLFLLEQGKDAQHVLDKEKDAIFALFIEREKEEFSYNPSVVTQYPDIEKPETSTFLTNTASYIAEQVCNVEKQAGKRIARVVILTTYGDRLMCPLEADGYQTEQVKMPAGPDNTFIFSKQLTEKTPQQEQVTLYLEAVNENDEKIRPTFVLKLMDENGVLCGGACGSITEHEKKRYAYIATLAVKKGMPQSSGSCLAAEMLHFLQTKDVTTANLGTQTASAFYKKHGFSVIHHIVTDLRRRIVANGQTVTNDLVIMKKDL